jgi:hypothetical protein
MSLDPMPTTTASELMAADVMSAIDAVEGLISTLEHPHPETRRHVRGGRTVSRDFIISMIGAVEDKPEMQQLGLDVDEARHALEFEAAFRPVVDRLSQTVSAVIFTIESKKARVAKQALMAYSIARRMSRREGSELNTILEILGKHLGHGRPRKRQQEDAPPGQE